MRSYSSSDLTRTVTATAHASPSQDTPRPVVLLTTIEPEIDVGPQQTLRKNTNNSYTVYVLLWTAAKTKEWRGGETLRPASVSPVVAVPCAVACHLGTTRS